MYSPYENRVIYQLFLRVFTPEGTLAAAEKKLPFLQSLGVDYIYLCPCFVQDDDPDPAHWSKRQRDSGYGEPRNPYRIKDYFAVDPEYGTTDDLRRFVHTAHGLGLRVLLDLVYLHCGPQAEFLAEYPDFVRRTPQGDMEYGEWSFPLLNFDNPALREYLWGHMEWCVRELAVDGFRCDVGDECPVDFWREGVRRCRAIRPELFMLDEGCKPRWLEEAFDAGYLLFWPEHEAVKHVFAGDTPAVRLQQIDAVLDVPRGRALIRALDTHDTVCDDPRGRYETYAGHEATDAALVFQFCTHGIPFLYNGYEVADDAPHSIFSSRFCAGHHSIRWEQGDTPQGTARLRLVRRLTALRHTVPALYEGTMSWKYGLPETTMAFIRRAPGSRVVAAFNTGSTPQHISLGANIRITETLLSRGVQLPHSEDGQVLLELQPKAYFLAVFADEG